MFDFDLFLLFIFHKEKKEKEKHIWYVIENQQKNFFFFFSKGCFLKVLKQMETYKLEIYAQVNNAECCWYGNWQTW